LCHYPWLIIFGFAHNVIQMTGFAFSDLKTAPGIMKIYKEKTTWI